MFTPFFFVLLVFNLTVSTIGDVLAKLSGTRGNDLFVLGLVFNIMAIASFMFLIRIGGLAISPSIVLLLTILIDVLFGLFMFHEEIEMLQWVGIGMGVMAIMLISNIYKSLF